MSDLTAADFKKIIARRDPRFDGRFYFGVKTTKIYCRPVCPATPKPENILIFKSVSEAERSGFRPCLRCRPDLAPGHKLAGEKAAVVSRALRLMNDFPDDDLTVETLANRLRTNVRRLRRLFDNQLGASPIEIMSTQRLHFAKQSIQETARPMTEIAFAAGYRSIRRFNEAFKRHYRRSPSEFRKTKRAREPDAFTFRVPIRRPYDWTHVISYLATHETYGVERVENGEYMRFIRRKNGFGTIRISENPGTDYLSARFTNIPLGAARGYLARVRTLFDTDHNPLHLPAAPPIAPRGVRVPGNFDPFETAVSIILGQLVSTQHARAQLKKLVERFGRLLGRDASGAIYDFPPPRVLMNARIETVGVTKQKAGAIRELARRVARRAIDFDAHVEFSKAAEPLLAIRGIGPWTAAMIAMRCLGDPDAFPQLDLVVKRAIDRNIVDPSAWSSSRAYLVHCLWRDSALLKERPS